MGKHLEVGEGIAWVSIYGLYDNLSPHMQRLLEGLHAIHTLRLQFETTIISMNSQVGWTLTVFRCAQAPSYSRSNL